MDTATLIVCGPSAELRASPEITAAVSHLLSAESPGARFTHAVKYGRWDGVVRLMRGRTFPSGLVERVVTFLTAQGVTIDVRGPAVPVAAPITSILNGIELRPHQVRAADEAEQRRVVVLQSPTASGKTLIGTEIVRRLGGASALWLTHRVELAKQSRDVLRNALGIPVGLVQGTTADWRPVTVAMVPTLAARLKDRDPDVTSRLAEIRLVIADEAHHGAAATWGAVIRTCTNASWRIGLSGTVPKRDPLTDLQLEGLLGPTIVVAENQELEAAGFVATPTIRLLQPPPGTYPTYEWIREQVLPTWRDDARPLQRLGTQLFECAYQRGIVQNAARTALLTTHAMHHYAAGEKVLVMADRVEHAAHLASVLRRAGAERLWSVDGGSPDRAEVIERFRRFDPPALLVVTPWFREGMDLPEVDVGFLAGNVRSEIAILQAVGRMLRARPDKRSVLIYCCLDGRDPDAKKDYLAHHTAEVLRTFRERGWALERVRE